MASSEWAQYQREIDELRAEVERLRAFAADVQVAACVQFARSSDRVTRAKMDEYFVPADPIAEAIKALRGRDDGQ